MTEHEDRRGTLPVQHLRSGDHAFCGYAGQPGWDVLTAYAWRGLERDEKVIICSAPDVTADEVRARMEEHGPALDHVHDSGRLVLSSLPALFHPDRRFNSERQWQRIREETDSALAAGRSGLRTFIDMGWAADLGTDVEELTAHEAQTHQAFAGRPYSQVCAYDRTVFAPEVFKAAHDAHPYDLLDELGALRAQHGAGSVRLIGDADMATQVEWLAALREAVKDARVDGHLVVDLSRLHFLSVGCASDLLNVCVDAYRDGLVEVRCDRDKAALLVGLGSHYLKHVALIDASEVPPAPPLSPATA